MRQRQRFLVGSLLSITALYALLNYKTLLPSMNPEFRKPFLESPYWGDDKQKSTYEKFCSQNNASYCSSLAYLAEKHDDGTTALKLYQKACELGDKYGCDRAKDVTWWAARTDPYKDVNIRTLNNGVRVFSVLKPDSKDFMAAIEVAAGLSSETKANVGVAHLTEHLMFRQGQFDGKVGRLHAAEARGVRMNGVTQDDSTIYYVQAPDVTATWSTKLLVSMFDKPKFENDAVEKAKSEINLERQLRFPWFNHAMNDLFWFSKATRLTASDFGTPIIDRSLEDETASTARMHAPEVSQFFERNYTGDNTVVYLIGNYDPNKIDSMVDEVMGKLKKRGARPRALQAVRPKNTPSYSLDYENTWRSPRIRIGTKFWNAKAKDLVALDVYAEYVANRLMVELREKGANTYTASGRTTFYPYGMSYVDLEVKPGDLFKDTYLLRNTLRKEAARGDLKDWQLQEAIWLYRHHYLPSNLDIASQLNSLQQQAFFQRAFGPKASPFQILNRLHPADMRRILKRYYGANHGYLVITNPYAGPYFLGSLVFVSLILPIIFLIEKRRRASALDAEVRYLAAVNDPIIAKLLRAFFALQIYNVVSMLESWGMHAIPGWKLDLSLFCIGELSLSLIRVGVFVAFALWLFGGRIKECRVGKRSLVNVLGFGLRQNIPLEAISRIESCKFWQQSSGSPRLMSALNVILRFNWLGSGAMIRCHDGTYFFIPTKDPMALVKAFEAAKLESSVKSPTVSADKLQELRIA